MEGLRPDGQYPLGLMEIQWTADKVDWLRIASETPSEKGKRPGDTRLAEMATSQFGVEVTRHQVRHAVERFIERGETPLKADGHEGKPPEVALLLRRLDALDAEMKRERDRNLVITEAIRSTVSALEPPAVLPLPKTGADDPHAAMADISDIHLGEKVDALLTGGLSQYDFGLFKSRMERYRRGFYKIIGIHRRAYPVDDLYINLLGDVVTGEAIYPGQAFQIDLPLLRQVFEGGYALANLLSDFSRSFRIVRVRCVAGNHGRGGEKGKNHPRTNWDLAVYELLKILLASHANVEVEVSETSWLVYEIPGHRSRHVLLHGDQVRGWGSIPWYGFERSGAAMQSMLGLPLEYYHAGHVHNAAEWDSNRLNFRINGSWVGGSDLSVNKMSRAAVPTQNLFLCHPRRGIAATYQVQLDDWADLQSDEKGIYRVKERMA